MARRSWGALRKLPSGRYQAKYRVNGVFVAAPQTFPNKAQADRWLASKQAEADRGESIDDRAGARSLSAWWPDYERSMSGLRATTCNGYEAAWRLRIKPTFGARPVRRIKASDIDAWLSKLREDGVSAGKITEAHGVLSRLLDRAVRDQAIPRNPCLQRTEKLPRRKQITRPVLSPSEVEKLVKPMAQEVDRLAVRLMAYGGLRIGEVLGLHWDDIDIARKTLTVRRSVNDNTGMLIVEAPKNGIVRTVTLPDSLVSQLKDLMGKGLFYPNRTGIYRRYRNWRRDVWDRAVKASGVAALPHDLRATCASLLIDAGASIKDVQDHLGHADVTTTMEIYARVRPGRNIDIASKLDALIAET
jgi:integrase